MKVILLTDVAKIGRKYEVKEVSDGYGLNFLIPRKLAELATPQKIATRMAKVSAQIAHDKAAHDVLLAQLKTLTGEVIEVTARANDQGHLYEKVSAGHIVLELEKKGVVVSEQMIRLEEAPKAVGEYSFSIVVGNEHATLKLSVKKAV